MGRPRGCVGGRYIQHYGRDQVVVSYVLFRTVGGEDSCASRAGRIDRRVNRSQVRTMSFRPDRILPISLVVSPVVRRTRRRRAVTTTSRRRQTHPCLLSRQRLRTPRPTRHGRCHASSWRPLPFILPIRSTLRSVPNGGSNRRHRTGIRTTWCPNVAVEFNGCSLSVLRGDDVTRSPRSHAIRPFHRIAIQHMITASVAVSHGGLRNSPVNWRRNSRHPSLRKRARVRRRRYQGRVTRHGYLRYIQVGVGPIQIRSWGVSLTRRARSPRRNRPLSSAAMSHPFVQRRFVSKGNRQRQRTHRGRRRQRRRIPQERPVPLRVQRTPRGVIVPEHVCHASREVRGPFRHRRTGRVRTAWRIRQLRTLVE